MPFQLKGQELPPPPPKWRERERERGRGVGREAERQREKEMEGWRGRERDRFLDSLNNRIGAPKTCSKLSTHKLLHHS